MSTLAEQFDTTTASDGESEPITNVSIVISKASLEEIYPGLIMANGAGVYACLASVDLFELETDDFVDHVDDIITIGDFYHMAAGGQIVFTQ